MPTIVIASIDPIIPRDTIAAIFINNSNNVAIMYSDEKAILNIFENSKASLNFSFSINLNVAMEVMRNHIRPINNIVMKSAGNLGASCEDNSSCVAWNSGLNLSRKEVEEVAEILALNSGPIIAFVRGTIINRSGIKYIIDITPNFIPFLNRSPNFDQLGKINFFFDAVSPHIKKYVVGMANININIKLGIY